MKAIFLSLLILITAAVAQDAEPPVRPKWNEPTFGISLKKPDKGKNWVVDSRSFFSDAVVLKPDDEILEIDGKRITIADDAHAILNSAANEVTIKARREIKNAKTGKRIRTVTDEATFKKSTPWELSCGMCDQSVDALHGFVTWTPKEIPAALKGQTAIIPSVILDKDKPTHARLRFQYFGDDWLFIQKVTVKHGEKLWVFDEQFGSVNQEAERGVLSEWFIEADGPSGNAAAMIKWIGENPTETSLIRFEGRAYFKDHVLSSTEVIGFILMSNFLTTAEERYADISKK